MAEQRDHAIIVGGGIAGLVAARVLRDHYRRVTVIERDHYPDAPAFRPGVPQGRHVHTMLLRGQHILEELFPGFTQKLEKYGAIARAYGAESLYYYGGGRCPKIAPVLRGWNASRLLVEFLARQEVAAFAEVQFLMGQEVIALCAEGGQVNGVQYRQRDSSALTNPIVSLQADLVVDAAGIDSPIGKWMEELGYAQPEEECVDAGVGYATRWYLPPENWRGWKGVVVVPKVPGRSGTLMEVEGGRWMVLLSGRRGDYPPTDEKGFSAFIESLPDPALAEALAEASADSPVYSYRRTENRRRYFERLKHPPAGLLVMGDALCAFNPLYGQGMTVAALEAQALAACLRAQVSNNKLPLLFYGKASRLLNFPWRMAAGADARTSQRGYVAALIALVPHDARVFLTFLEVINLLRSPLALFRPWIIGKVLRQSLRRSG